MNARDRFAAVRRIFLAAGERSEGARAEFVERECAGDGELLREVRALLEHERAPDARLEAPALGQVFGAHAAEPTSTAEPTRTAQPTRIGEFEIVGVLGTGGMGVVYEAEQASPRRRVALKVIRSPFATQDELRRFEHEGRALGWLNHPGIATIFAAGIADAGHGPQPYLAMELVRGERLDAHAKRAELGVRERLELLARLCDAVHHAHQKGVIHRDLKPGNVLVDENGQPKILDFGVARIVGGEVDPTTRHTSAGQILGTLPYMSPEQVRADPALIDVRSDVYALGVIGYELLCGRRPLDVDSRALPEAIRAIVSDEPTSLGALDRRLRGEIETIVHKAMAKEKERRYASAAELASDLRRYLASEPILARPASRSYQMRKFAARNRVLVGGVAAVFLVLLAGAITSTVLYLEKEEQRAAATRRGEELGEALAESEQNLARALGAERLARDESGTAEAVTDYLVTLFEYANPEDSREGAITALEMLDRGVERIRGQFQDRPAIRARLLNVFGKIENYLQRYDRSGPILEEALALVAELEGEDSAGYADTLERLAQVRLDAGDVEAAESMHRRVLALREKHLGTDDPLYTDALNNLANSLMTRGEFVESERLFLEARERRVARFGEAHPDVASIDYGLGMVDSQAGRNVAAALRLRSALASFRSSYGEDHWRTLMARSALADVLPSTDGEARELARDAYEGMRRLFGEENLLTSRALKIYATTVGESGDHEEAVRILEELLARQEGVPGREMDRAMLLDLLATNVHDLGRHEEAESLYLDALEIHERLGGDARDVVLRLQHNLSVLYQQTGRLQEALVLARGVVAEREELLGLAHPDTRGSLNNLAEVYRKLGRSADEEATRRRKLAAVRATLGDDVWETRLARDELAAFLTRAGRPAEAAALESP